MAHLQRSDIVTLLKSVRLPDGESLADAAVLSSVSVAEAHVSVVIDADQDQRYKDNPGALATVRADTQTLLDKDPRVEKCTVVLTGGPVAAPKTSPMMTTDRPTAEAEPEENAITHIIAVGSGKGGVGKSTVAANLAVALAQLGKRVGLMDADVYGPSVQLLLGLKDSPNADGKKIEPLDAFGIKAMTMGLLVDQSTPMIWRGPMVGSAILQLLNDVAWGALDVLVVDMPPGTGDAQLTLAQRTPLAGAVIVSTPQDLALIDARKAITMFEKVKVPVLGLVENMSVFICPNCGHESHIFAHGGGEEAAKEIGIPFLGHLPLDMDIRISSDAGTPVAASGDSPQAGAFLSLAGSVLDQLDASDPLPPPRLVMA